MTAPATFVRSPKPPLTLQPATRGQVAFTCWADAWISWIAAQPKKQPWWLPKIDLTDPDIYYVSDQIDAAREALLNQFQPFLGPKQGFRAAGPVGIFGVELLLRSADMDFKLFTDPRALSGGIIMQKLRIGNIYAFFVGNPFTPGGVAHAIVVYGMTATSEMDPELMVMDPWPGKGYGIRRLSYLQASRQVVVAWPR